MTTVRALVRQGPGAQIAFLPQPQPEQIAESLVAFANAEGGTLVLGVYPNGTVGDLLMEDEADGALRAALALCRPPMPTQWQSQETPAGIVVLLRVERSSDLHMLADGRVLIRSGSENRPMDGPALQVTAANKSLGDFEMEPVSGTTEADLDEDIIQEYLKKRQQRNPHGAVLADRRMLEEIGAISSNGIPTVSGILLFGKNPQTYLPHSRTVFVKFGGERPQGAGGSFGYGRREEITGPLARIVERVWRVVWEEIDKKAVVKGLTREEQLEYPQFAVREALINAVCHRDYRLRGSSIEIRMYTDRLEVISPGGLPAYITLDNIVDEHYSRNPRIVNGLYQWGYIEELGLGVDRMIEDMVAAGHPPPVFDAQNHRFTVKLFNRKDASKVIPHWEQNMNERQIKAMQFIQANGSITNRDYRDLCSHVGAESLRLDLADLVEKGLLLKIGDKRGTRYILK